MVIVWLFGCAQPAPTLDTGDPEVPVTCPTFETHAEIGVVPSPPATEVSGLAVVDDTLWVHNDGSEGRSLFALTREGTQQGAWTLDVSARDVEDMAHAPDGTLFLGDIGDNAQARPSIAIFTVPTPVGADGLIPAVVQEGQYPDGPRDAETLLYDDSDNSLWVVSKELDGQTGFYRFAPDAMGPQVMERVAVIQMGTEPLGQTTLVTGGDFGAHGLVLRTYLTTAFVWPRAEGEGIAEVLQREPCPVELAPELQGEAIGWGPDGLYTISEGTEPPVNFHALVDP